MTAVTPRSSRRRAAPSLHARARVARLRRARHDEVDRLLDLERIPLQFCGLDIERAEGIRQAARAGGSTDRPSRRAPALERVLPRPVQPTPRAHCAQRPGRSREAPVRARAPPPSRRDPAERRRATPPRSAGAPGRSRRTSWRALGLRSRGRPARSRSRAGTLLRRDRRA